VEFAANGADVAIIDIAGPVNTASDAKPATAADLAETVRQVKAYGRKSEAIRADIRDINALKTAAERIENAYGKIDIVVADAAIQRWKPLLEMRRATTNVSPRVWPKPGRSPRKRPHRSKRGRCGRPRFR
jgi:NAD(P)-dependent dehydrogenase (short-subunit alcohol dehydrogenase family)